MWAAIPLLLSGVELPEVRDEVTVFSGKPAFDAGERILLHGPLSHEQALARARAMMLLFPASALTYVYLLGNWLGNGLIAMHNFRDAPVEVGLRVEEGEQRLTDLCTGERTGRSRGGTHRVTLETYSYRWYRGGGSSYSLRWVDGDSG